MNVQKTTTKAANPGSAEEKGTIVIDLGKHKKKRVNRLRKGKGRLMDDVEEALEDLRAEGHIDAKAQAVVVVVRRKSRRSRMW